VVNSGHGERRPPGVFRRRKPMQRLSLILIALASFVLATADIMPGWR
jgi:hypothetical protein